MRHKNLAIALTEKYGKGWSFHKLQHCVRSAYTFSEDEIAYAVRTQLTWTHLRSLMSIDDGLKRSFYVEMCRLEHWDTRTLNEKIDSQLYELTALSKKPEDVIMRELAKIKETNTLTPDIVFRPIREPFAYPAPLPLRPFDDPAACRFAIALIFRPDASEHHPFVSPPADRQAHRSSRGDGQRV